MEKEILSRCAPLSHGQLPGSLELAYLGDAVFDLYVRARLVGPGGRVKLLHREASLRVCAHAQSGAMDRVEGLLTEAERDVARRARNVHQHPPKNALPAEYHRATSLEALIGYLALTGRYERLDELMKVILEES